MRIKFAKIVAFVVVTVNVIIIYYTLRLFISYDSILQRTAPVVNPVVINKPQKQHISKLITVVIREFDNQGNDVSSTAYSFIDVFSSIQVVILYDKPPYPPLNIKNFTKNIKTVNLSPNVRVPFTERYPLFQIKTKYVLFVPDSTRVVSKQPLQNMLTEVAKEPNTIIVTGFRKNLNCLRIHLNTREWTLRYGLIKGPECDGVSGKQAILVETELLKQLTNAFFIPFPQAFYIQTAALSIKVKVLKGVYFQEGKIPIKSHHAQQRKKHLEGEQYKSLFKLLQIKQVVRENGLTEWYGCTRETARCFSPVVNRMPSYLFEAKWTPPCCLSNLKKTARHVFNSLDESGIRYWLEAGSLLGAMRSGSILPWDHDVDIGFNRDDTNRNPWLRKARNKSVVDDKGFLWEKATEGNFYRIYYSKQNKIFVNLFPFYSRNGTMTKDSWFGYGNMEFPENFLHPMSSIEFIGKTVPSPNNIRDFLEIKFGKGAIENPQYPDPDKITFP